MLHKVTIGFICCHWKNCMKFPILYPFSPHALWVSVLRHILSKPWEISKIVKITFNRHCISFNAQIHLAKICVRQLLVAHICHTFFRAGTLGTGIPQGSRVPEGGKARQCLLVSRASGQKHPLHLPATNRCSCSSEKSRRHQVPQGWLPHAEHLRSTMGAVAGGQKGAP